MISKEEVKRIAQLARIEIVEDQTEKYQAELSAILDFVGTLSSVDTAKVLQIRQITGLESVFRKDENHGQIYQGQTLVEQAPEHKEGYIVVPEVLKGK
ncbi:MAG: Asp-tRNA(Asn)/Glu-tRNA(Gln) amidotransferase subunit GatC [Candidatus Sungbacteria bacterium]|uniref:Aspartyl/glutamyl-tRNA(Asn/Gln) amidotransferase subunit C n=1 Tax=Candidatus Sungiibacteriota bacterium TaxID=2750080 RepID=A0A932DSG2_9BACT|nr:Asp-tRNA(Asn)/Glu-tRNA(Gln) amidotransferase subunit GatC [Candidatus Sungbacteria bacterium]